MEPVDRGRLNEEDHAMFDHDILAKIQADEQARIDATMRETSPAAVLARMEREQSLGRPGPLRNALVEALWGARGAAVRS